MPLVLTSEQGLKLAAHSEGLGIDRGRRHTTHIALSCLALRAVYIQLFLFFADGPGQQLYVLRRPSLKHKQTLATYTYSAPIAELAVDCSPVDPLLYVLLANSQLFEEQVAQLAENAEYRV